MMTTPWENMMVYVTFTSRLHHVYMANIRSINWRFLFFLRVGLRETIDGTWWVKHGFLSRILFLGRPCWGADTYPFMLGSGRFASPRWWNWIGGLGYPRYPRKIGMAHDILRIAVSPMGAICVPSGSEEGVLPIETAIWEKPYSDTHQHDSAQPVLKHPTPPQGLERKNVDGKRCWSRIQTATKSASKSQMWKWIERGSSMVWVSTSFNMFQPPNWFQPPDILGTSIHGVRSFSLGSIFCSAGQWGSWAGYQS